MSIFGRLYSTNQLEDSITDFLRVWIPSYLSEVEKQNGIEAGSYPRPKNFNVAFDIDKWPEQQLPIVTVLVLGPEGEPAMQNDGVYACDYKFQVAVLFKANDAKGVHRGVGVWNAAIMGAIVQHGSIGGIAEGTWVQDFGEDTLYGANNRTLGVAVSEYVTRIPNIIESRKGPATPPVDPNVPPSPFPPVSHAEVDVQALPTNQEIN